MAFISFGELFSADVYVAVKSGSAVGISFTFHTDIGTKDSGAAHQAVTTIERASTLADVIGAADIGNTFFVLVTSHSYRELFDAGIHSAECSLLAVIMGDALYAFVGAEEGCVADACWAIDVL